MRCPGWCERCQRPRTDVEVGGLVTRALAVVAAAGGRTPIVGVCAECEQAEDKQPTESHIGHTPPPPQA